MHINTRKIKNSLKILNPTKCEVVGFRALNDRDMLRASAYIFIIMLAYCMHFLPSLLGMKSSIVLTLKLAFMMGGVVQIGLIFMILFIHLMMIGYTGYLFVLYCKSLMYSRKLFYLYWRLNKYMEYFLEKYYNLNDQSFDNAEHAVTNTDVVKFFNMFLIYLSIKNSFSKNGMMGELHKKYRGVMLSHDIDEDARVLLRELSECFLRNRRTRGLFVLLTHFLFHPRWPVDSLIVEHFRSRSLEGCILWSRLPNQRISNNMFVSNVDWVNSKLVILKNQSRMIKCIMTYMRFHLTDEIGREAIQRTFDAIQRQFDTEIGREAIQRTLEFMNRTLEEGINESVI